MSEALTVVNNQAPLARVEAQRNALSRLFQLKPATLELVSKSTRQEGAVPGTFRDTSTNEKFETMKAVILFPPVEQRALYTKGEYSRDAKQCFSLDNVQPHAKAKDPKAMYCNTCQFGDLGWNKYREAKAAGVKGDALSALVPQCKKYWHLFIANRATQMPYYFNVKGTSVSPFEQGMQNIARIFSLIISNIKLENQKINAENAKLVGDEGKKPLLALPQGVEDIIWQISFTMFAHQPEKGGQFVLGLKDFAVMKPEDQAEFGAILQDFIARRNAGKIQSQLESEAEAAATESNAVEASTTEATSTVAEQNAKITI